MVCVATAPLIPILAAVDLSSPLLSAILSSPILCYPTLPPRSARHYTTRIDSTCLVAKSVVVMTTPFGFVSGFAGLLLCSARICVCVCATKPHTV